MQINDKKSQRAYYKNMRLKLEKSAKAALDKGVYDNFLSFAENNKDKLFLMYVSNGFEIETKAIIEYLLENGFNVAAPRCESDSNIMNFYMIESLSDLESGYFGISEPKNYCEQVSDFGNSICVVPGICFDKKGYRIGYGKGFYDRFFSDNTCGLKIGICYEDFIINDVLYDDNDVPVDLILTECSLHERSLL